MTFEGPNLSGISRSTMLVFFMDAAANFGACSDSGTKVGSCYCYLAGGLRDLKVMMPDR